MENSSVNFKWQQIQEAIHLCRSFVLDSIELEVGDKPNWKYLRSRLLRAFGDRGLENRIQQILTEQESNGGRPFND
ncbi:MAG: hypothetical protein A2W61_07985 [Deltaproteobacteria bacterium RIFCSPLOWO2_01_44_7]|nr:MAG: hypothetical protein A2712_10365 [Deltaproteobacteria bacterium RIFCSPHIGHO2_01_FULL_43_49]OGQ15512.1 MAG: hypothetical protein A3D22_10895 [Deltaproteobacteria bacterium RIFCSPHIGHO2_02_FULL_44_53]OGQ28454.1 MAG: hypothetical protein A3D98_03080 [Deltaproteobacteria bacterium RIFCSPHIGHO2_12_FULL_44_21]OGQ32318.1 MAG: hypothetical protein A2979_00740 [Deltaproteobacteria bacterium RIFCSPLOWO2_01_FULL_45_74]OGQ37681.1 MAG: hypothetical protein A2W61_07985 [Deltaproteobacteria bacterium 